MAINIAKGDIGFEVGGKVLIEDVGLRTALVQNNAETLEFLREQSPGLKPEEIDIDDAGRITIRNSNLADAIRAAGDSNGICGLRC